jgi:uncharacterized repeat protein (TIGR01451 family)
MNLTKTLLAGASIIASAIAAAPAMAQQTQTASGTVITNTVKVDYKVGGVDQTQISSSDSFTVDRKINLVVAPSDSSTTNVSPGQQAAVIAFVVSNTSNATLDFALSAANNGTDDFDATGIKIYADTNSNGVYNAGTDLEITYLDQVASDTNRTVFVVANIPADRPNLNVAGIRLTATSHESTASGSLGAVVAQTTGANTAGVDTVFADSNSGGNTASDGIHFADDSYTISAASLTVTKTSKIISDPVNSTTNPKMIPGAVVEYCVIVANASNSSTATNVTITDTLPAATTYLSSFGILLNGTVVDNECQADGASGGTHADGTIDATLSDIAAGVKSTVLFRVTVK